MILAKLVVGLAATLVVGTTYLVQDGFVHVSVDENYSGGTHLHLIVPAMIAPIAAACIPERHLHGAREQVQAYLPAIRTAAFELNKLPDAVLVDVHDNQQHVRVSKAGGGLKIEVQSPDEHVDVWVPLRAAYDTASSLESRFRDGK
jgi:hypothetical protein